MPLEPPCERCGDEADDGEDLVRRVRSRDPIAFETLMRRHNGRLFRVARAILRDDAEAEDALQDAYVDAFRHIGDFRCDSRLATWLTRVVINHALMRLRKQKRERTVVPIGRPMGDDQRREEDVADEKTETAYAATLRKELRQILERRIDELPLSFRTVFVMREVEDMSVEETAGTLGIPPATVRTRLFRARALLREALSRDIDGATVEVFGFDGERCDRIVATVLARAAGQP